MSRLSLREMKDRKAAGHRYVQLVVHRERRPRTNRIRIMPGVLGVYIGETANAGFHMVDVLLDDLIPALEKESVDK